MHSWIEKGIRKERGWASEKRGNRKDHYLVTLEPLLLPNGNLFPNAVSTGFSPFE